MFEKLFRLISSVFAILLLLYTPTLLGDTNDGTKVKAELFPVGLSTQQDRGNQLAIGIVFVVNGEKVVGGFSIPGNQRSYQFIALIETAIQEKSTMYVDGVYYPSTASIAIEYASVYGYTCGRFHPCGTYGRPRQHRPWPG